MTIKRRSSHIEPMSHSLDLRFADDITLDCWWPQRPHNCDASTRKVISNSLDVFDFIPGYIHDRSFKKGRYFSRNAQGSYPLYEFENYFLKIQPHFPRGQSFRLICGHKCLLCHLSELSLHHAWYRKWYIFDFHHNSSQGSLCFSAHQEMSWLLYRND